MGQLLKVVALVLWFLAAFTSVRANFQPYGGSLVAAGLFFWFVGDVFPL